jgi:hypothetical protein
MKGPAANDAESLMSVERDRTPSLIEFSQQSARLRGKPAATIAAHGRFAFHEYEIQGLPGIQISSTNLRSGIRKLDKPAPNSLSTRSRSQSWSVGVSSSRSQGQESDCWKK